MYDVRQFKPALYLLVLLGITGFAVASGALLLWLGATALIVLNAVLVAHGAFRPIPRMAANVSVVAAAAYTVVQVTTTDATVPAIGQFLVALQVVKLYEQRGNRDYGQLIVLSLLLMVAAAISTTVLAFGVLLVVYLFLSLYCCLLFHLKVETDAARQAMGLRDDHPGDIKRLRQDQRRLNSSMRRLTSLLAVVAVTCAALVFLLFPRGAGSQLFARPPFDSAKAVSGFSGRISFQHIARISQNTTPVAHVELLRDGQPIRGGETFYFRGSTLDIYVSDPDAADRWTWRRSAQPSMIIPDGYPDQNTFRAVFELGPPMSRPTSILEQRVELEPVGIDVLPTLSGPFLLSGSSSWLLRHNIADDTLNIDTRMTRRPIRYTVWSTGSASRSLPARTDSFLDGARAMQDMLLQLKRIRDRAELMRLATLGQVQLAGRSDAERAAELHARFALGVHPQDLLSARMGPQAVNVYAQRDLEDALYPIPPAIIEFATDPRVSGAAADGSPLAQVRLRHAGPSELDETIARNIERYLQQQYEYTLDLTDARLSSDQDPMAWFVSEEGRRGHCEYFAGTAALACQALGIPARVVVGFRTEEYNDSLERYVIRQAHAHAWVEVLTNYGWIVIDPTASTTAHGATAERVPFQQLRHWLEFLEYSWANNVVAYDNSARASLMQDLEGNIAAQTRRGATWWQQFQNWLEQQNLYIYSAKLMAWLIALAALAAAAAVTWFVVERLRLRRRLRRIGLRSLPADEARRLARQLAFYDEMLQVLQRHGHQRRPSQTPREFARSLTVLPRQGYDLVLGLTDVFYRVRFGSARLSRRRQRWVGHSLDRLEGVLDGR